MHYRFVQKIEIVISNRQDNARNPLLNTLDSTHNQKAWTFVIWRERRRRIVKDCPKFFLNLENIKARCLNHNKPLVACRGKSHEC